MVTSLSNDNTIIHHNAICVTYLFSFILGCNSIEVGIESFSDSQLSRYNKHVTADDNIQSYEAIMNYYGKYQFRYIHELIPFDPWVSREELIYTIDFYIKNKFDYLELEPWLFTKLILYPNTVLRSKAERESIISRDSHIEIPFWNFIDNDIAMIYSALMRYKTTLLPKLNLVRDNMQYLIKSNEVTLAQKIVYLRIKERLSRITVDYFMELLIRPISEYEEIFNNKANAIEHYLKMSGLGNSIANKQERWGLRNERDTGWMIVGSE